MSLPSLHMFCLPQHKNGDSSCSSSLHRTFLHLHFMLVIPNTSSILFCASPQTMACDSTCCPPPKALPASVHTPNPALPNIDIGDSHVTCAQDTSSQSQLNDMGKDYHDSSAKCTPKKNGCDSIKSVDVEAYDLKRPSCCEGKTSPCCDFSCIDRIALRDCATESESPSSCALQSATDPYTL